MPEWRVCPGCGYSKHGACPGCFPALAEAERRAELIEWQLQEEDRARKDAGQLWCAVHEIHDGCVRKRSMAEVRALRGGERRPVTWQEAMAELRRRYVSP